jgi:hypothetical protein
MTQVHKLLQKGAKFGLGERNRLAGCFSAFSVCSRMYAFGWLVFILIDGVYALMSLP